MAKSRFAKAAEAAERTRRRGAPSKVIVTDEMRELIGAWVEDGSPVLPFDAFDETASLADGGDDGVSQDTFVASEDGDDDDAKRKVNTVRERIARNLRDVTPEGVSVTVLKGENAYTFGLTRKG